MRSLRGTGVLRWEYRPGSTLYFVWTQIREGFDQFGDFDFSRDRSALFRDMLELTVRNETDAAHPYHLHGFSMQPLRMVKNSDGTTLYDFDYDEFIDTMGMFAAATASFADVSRVAIGEPEIADVKQVGGGGELRPPAG